MKKKIFLGKIVFGLLPKYIEKKKKNFVAIQFLYCREGSLKGWRYCIVRTKKFVLQALQLYCKRECWKNCSEIFVLQEGHCIVI